MIFRKKGFTLVELMIVIVIIGILAAIIIPTVTNAIGKANKAKLQAEVSQMNTRLMIESIFDGVYAYRADEVEAILEDIGFRLDQTPSGYSLWYDQSQNKIIFEETENLFNGTSDYVAYAAEGELPVRVEALIEGKPELLYIDKTNTPIRTMIEELRVLPSTANATATDAASFINNIDGLLVEILGNLDGKVNQTVFTALQNHVENNFDTENTLYVSEKYMASKKTLNAISGEVAIKNIHFDSYLTKIPELNIGAGVTVKSEVIIEVPTSVQTVEPGAFTSFKDTIFQIPTNTNMENNSFNLDGTCSISYVESVNREVQHLDVTDISITYKQIEGLKLGGTIENLETIDANTKNYLTEYYIPSISVQAGELIPNMTKLQSFVLRRQKFGGITKIMAVAVVKTDNGMKGYLMDNVGYITEADEYSTKSSVYKLDGATLVSVDNNPTNTKFWIKLPSGAESLTNYKNATVKITYDIIATPQKIEASLFGTQYYVPRGDADIKVCESLTKEITFDSNKLWENETSLAFTTGTATSNESFIWSVPTDTTADGYVFNVVITKIEIIKDGTILFMRDFTVNAK